ncbi:hypothetical protein KDW_56000 [Dictyobacter vulcani]|uniref:Uncharacterized protein n=1 Tax=Dictyobacter vulcani TaxID=2607529 RepID=A0A5J4KNX4_9CHLR|nr:hypothetical protein KDW_56000 [Dictyobacter vulcani]
MGKSPAACRAVSDKVEGVRLSVRRSFMRNCSIDGDDLCMMQEPVKQSRRQYLIPQ